MVGNLAEADLALWRTRTGTATSSIACGRRRPTGRGEQWIMGYEQGGPGRQPAWSPAIAAAVRAGTFHRQRPRPGAESKRPSSHGPTASRGWRPQPRSSSVACATVKFDPRALMDRPPEPRKRARIAPMRLVPVRGITLVAFSVCLVGRFPPAWAVTRRRCTSFTPPARPTATRRCTK